MEARCVMACPRLDILPESTLPEVAVAGRSNCGKSTLINALAEHNGLARTSGTPGRTRELVFFWLRASGATPFHLVDLPGYGYAKVSRQQAAAWEHLVGGYIESRRGLGLVLLLTDIRRPPGTEERDLLSWCTGRGIPTCVVLTKADKLSKHKRFAQISAVKKGLGLVEAPLTVSAPKRLGIDQLRQRVIDVLGVREGE
ncbi:MAG: ribosome biogenesis GTP-binding protein YsxC [Deltaproteobacteria bacterium]|nr:ribosome biogenesis GTP-binding protein YsxC [Deltaproteobacteria bacterium]